MSSQSVQFHGLDNVLQAFINKEVPYYAVCQGANILEKNQDIEDMNEAAEKLRTFLNMLHSGSNAVYTIRIYEEVGKGGIKANTPADFSFNFRLNLPGMFPAQQTLQAQERQSRMDLLEQKIDSVLFALEAKKAEEETEEEEETQSAGNVGNIVGALITNPAIQNAIAGVFAAWISKIMPKPETATALAGTDASELDNTINELRTYDDNLEAHLAKLLAIAKANPNQFKMLLSMLDSF